MKVLIVEDNKTLLKQLVRSLREHSYVVDSAENGEEGLYKVLNWPFDLLIMDVMLPEMSGFEVLKRLRKVSEVPVLLLTARGHISDKVEGLNLGADDYIVKPFEMNELLARIRSILRRSKSQVQPDIEVGELTIKMNSGQVFKSGEEILLTNMEYTILMKLVVERGKIISASSLLDAVLDENDDSMSNSLNVHLFNIRKKLGKNVIQTIRGRGYRVS
ncbi:MAG: response regulator transcription factor [Verrucomicrobiota bacterium]